MSISQIGLSAKSRSISISQRVEDQEPLIQLCNALDFNYIAALVLPELKQTEKGFWWLGRALILRVHLAILILQVLLKQTDRGIEKHVRQTPIAQVFCGYGVVPRWKCPDHTKIETFRNRLSSETHRKIGDYIITLARDLGFADPSWLVVDSTVQEANIAYPSDASLMRKIAAKAHQVVQFVQENLPTILPADLFLDIAAISKAAKNYFFLSKNTIIEKKREVFKNLYQLVEEQISPVIAAVKDFSDSTLSELPWNIRRAIKTIQTYAHQYLVDVRHFIENHTMWPDKILSFHAQAVKCIRKGKVGKDSEFGRVFQLGRIGGNFMIVYACDSVRMDDKTALVPVVKHHIELFGADTLKTVSTDKCYYSEANVKAIAEISVDTQGLQRPVNIKKQPSGDKVLQLHNQRAGIEPLIGHVKEFGLRRSKMKSDQATLSSGYRSTMGFNLHQLQRHLSGEVIMNRAV